MARLTKKRLRLFLEILMDTDNVSLAASKIGMSRSRMYQYKNEKDESGELVHADFSKAWDEAVEIATDTLVHEARRRAVGGVKKPVGWYQGHAGGEVREYSDALLMFLIKAHRPEYRDKIDANIQGDITIIKQEPGYKGSTKVNTKKEKKDDNASSRDGEHNSPAKERDRSDQGETE